MVRLADVQLPHGQAAALGGKQFAGELENSAI